jgi:hypothetical protein
LKSPVIVCQNFGITRDGVVIPNPSVGESLRLCPILCADVIVDLVVVAFWMARRSRSFRRLALSHNAIIICDCIGKAGGRGHDKVIEIKNGSALAVLNPAARDFLS